MQKEIFETVDMKDKNSNELRLKEGENVIDLRLIVASDIKTFENGSRKVIATMQDGKYWLLPLKVWNDIVTLKKDKDIGAQVARVKIVRSGQTKENTKYTSPIPLFS